MRQERWIRLGPTTKGAVLRLCERLLSFDGGVETARRNARDASRDDRHRALLRAEVTAAFHSAFGGAPADSPRASDRPA